MTDQEPTLADPWPFERTRVPKPRSLLSRVLGRADIRGATAEVRNLLADRPVGTVEPSEISDILRARGVSGAAARDVARAVWMRALSRFTRDDDLSGDEIAYLTQLRAALGLSERDAETMHVEIAQHHYGDLLTEVLADQKLTAEDWNRLDRLAASLSISGETRAAIHAEATRAVYQSAVASSVKDRRLSPAEQRYLERLETNLGITAAHKAATEATLRKFSFLWRIKNGDLPDVAAPIELRKGEVCHLATATAWHEVRQSAGGAADSVSHGTIRIAKGLSYHVGRVPRKPAVREALTPVDSGTVFVTSERVVFDGASTNVAIHHETLLGLEVYSDAIRLDKGRTRSPYLFPGDDVEIAAAVLCEALARAGR